MENERLCWVRDVTKIMDKVTEGKKLTIEEQKIFDVIDFNTLTLKQVSGNERIIFHRFKEET